MNEISAASIFDESKKEVFLVTSCDQGSKSGMIVTWVTSASLIPERKRLVLVVSPQNHTTQVLLQHRKFVIHLLSQDQVNLVPTFGLYSSRDVDKFSDVSFHLDDSGIPIIAGTCGWARGHIIAKIDGGDRFILLTDVDKEEVNPNQQPLLVQDLGQFLPEDILQQMQTKFSHDVERDRSLIRHNGRSKRP
jgi:flavin reductase (DIM6/NTAB) family NADH-FMN oxidoreductase RutF